MLENFVNEAFTTIYDVAKPTIQDVAKDLDQVINQIVGETDDLAPAQFAAGYLLELTGEDFEDYIVGCYTPNDDLTNKLDEAMSYYSKNQRSEGD